MTHSHESPNEQQLHQAIIRLQTKIYDLETLIRTEDLSPLEIDHIDQRIAELEAEKARKTAQRAHLRALRTSAEPADTTRTLVIVYNPRRFESLGRTKLAFNAILKALISEGHSITDLTTTSAALSDGSTVQMIPVTESLRGLRATHLYIDDSILELENGRTLIDRELRPIVMDDTAYAAIGDAPLAERIRLYGQTMRRLDA